MAKLNIMDRDNRLREFEISEDLITIGREATNKLVIADSSVSRQHAWLEKREDGYYLIDKNSSNGTYVNSKKVSQQKLNHNDKINLGSASMVFEDEDQVSATFIIPRPETASPATDIGKPDFQMPRNSDEVPTGAVPIGRPVPPLPEQPVPPPPPMASRPAVPPPPPPVPPAAAPVPPRPVPPPPAAPAPPPPPPKVEEPRVCPSCKKPIDPGARFCGFCGAPLAAAKPATPVSSPQPSVPPPPAAPPPPSVAPKPPAAPAAPKVAPPPPPPPPPRPVAPAAPVPPRPATAFPPAPQPPAHPAAAVTGLEYAGFGVRLIAYLIDAAILMGLSLLPALVVVFLMLRSDGTPSLVSIMIMVLCYAVIILGSLFYQLYFVGVKGATPGKKMMKLKVTFPDGQYPIGYGKAFLRMLGYMVSGFICYVGFLMIAFDKEQHRGLHDKIAGTVVIKQP